jgi:anti-sigma B factor antagonist
MSLPTTAKSPKGHRDVPHPGSSRPAVNAPDLPLCIEVQRWDDAAVVVRVAGELDSLTGPAVDRQLTAVEVELVAPATVVLDLSDLTFMSSAGLALLVAHHEWCAEHGSRLRVVTGNNRSVLRPVRITGLDTVLDLVATVADATGDDG